LLARRDHSEYELHRKLSYQGYQDSDIAALIHTLCLEGLLSNLRFTEAYIRNRRDKGYGPIRIQAELIARGIPQDMIDHHLNIADNDWFNSAYRTWQKRFKNTVPSDFQTRAKQMRFLQYRGFTAEHIDNIYHSETNHA
jgi:regulatory protein